jgi:hypothetical protein
MLVQTFAKPPPKKQRRAKRNKRPTDQDCCIITGKPYAALHEVFYGKNRQKSIEWGMQVRLSPEYHNQGAQAVHNNPRFNFRLKQEYQAIFESRHGHELFMQEFGSDYLAMTFEDFMKSEVRKDE